MSSISKFDGFYKEVESFKINENLNYAQNKQLIDNLASRLFKFKQENQSTSPDLTSVLKKTEHLIHKKYEDLEKFSTDSKSKEVFSSRLDPSAHKSPSLETLKTEEVDSHSNPVEAPDDDDFEKIEEDDFIDPLLEELKQAIDNPSTKSQADLSRIVNKIMDFFSDSMVRKKSPLIDKCLSLFISSPLFYKLTSKQIARLCYFWLNQNNMFNVLPLDDTTLSEFLSSESSSQKNTAGVREFCMKIKYETDRVFKSISFLAILDELVELRVIKENQLGQLLLYADRIGLTRKG